ncbi:MAG: hypothetical protein ABI123_06320 [Ginsengibacter sp.]|jgi:hypothetical protein
MKKIFLLLLFPICFQVSAQTNLPSSSRNSSKEAINKGFQKDKLFTGGTINVGFGNGTTSLGISPQLGYSVTDWLDAGITVNVNYISQRDNPNALDKLRQTTYGPGAFARLFPVEFLFATVAGEYNTTRLKFIPGNGTPTSVYSVSAPSFLVGGGYAGGRQKGSNSYYYLSVMWDLAGDVNSPYVDAYGRSNPIIRAGYNIGLFQGRGKMGRRY